jgi:hypothetical protein
MWHHSCHSCIFSSHTHWYHSCLMPHSLASLMPLVHLLMPHSLESPMPHATLSGITHASCHSCIFSPASCLMPHSLVSLMPHATLTGITHATRACFYVLISNLPPPHNANEIDLPSCTLSTGYIGKHIIRVGQHHIYIRCTYGTFCREITK